MLGNASGLIENSILWANAPRSIALSSGGSMQVRTSCLPEASSYPGAGNINADPRFANAAAGDLHLQSGSPCIDAGNTFIDYYPAIPGFQLLPATDIDGNWRITDGTGDGIVIVDMGRPRTAGTVGALE